MTAQGRLLEHGKENRATYMINIFGSVVPLLMFLFYVNGKIDSLATDIELAAAIHSHNTEGMHPEGAKKVGDVQKQLDSILSFQIEARIESQLRVVCQNPDLREALEESIRQLIRDFEALTGRPYERPTCHQLGANGK